MHSARILHLFWIGWECVCNKFPLLPVPATLSLSRRLSKSVCVRFPPPYRTIYAQFGWYAYHQMRAHNDCAYMARSCAIISSHLFLGAILVLLWIAYARLKVAVRLIPNALQLISNNLRHSSWMSLVEMLGRSPQFHCVARAVRKNYFCYMKYLSIKHISCSIALLKRRCFDKWS